MSEAMTLSTSNPRAGWSLRQVLAIDAATCLAMGLLLMALSEPLAAWLALPASLLFGAGVLLLPCAVLMAIGAAMRRPAPALVWLVIAGNAAWVLASGLVAFALFEPNMLGLAFVVAQAAVVVVLLVLERQALARHTA
jgi:hypothetical protein